MACLSVPALAESVGFTVTVLALGSTCGSPQTTTSAMQCIIGEREQANFTKACQLQYVYS